MQSTLRSQKQGTFAFESYVHYFLLYLDDKSSGSFPKCAAFGVFDVRPFCWTGLTYLDSGLRRSAGIANGQQMVQWTFAVSDSPWAELRSLLRSAGWRICQRWCLLTRTLFDYGYDLLATWPSSARPGISFHVKGKKEPFLGDYRLKSRKLNGFWPVKSKSRVIFSFHTALFQFRCPITFGMTEKEWRV